MEWVLKGGRPIYLQLIEQIKLRIVTGYYPAGGRLPPVRDLAAEAAVNPNTMQKALSELEREGLVYSQRTSGRFITEDETVITQIKSGLAKQQLDAFFESMEKLGYTRHETARLTQEAAGEAG